jgi:DNA-directed RNA polymerase subunit K/omega
MINRPAESSAFEFVILAALRAAQLMRGCTPRVPASPKAVVTAQREVAEGKVVRALKDAIVLPA